MTKIDMRRTKKFLDGEFLFRYYFTEMGAARSHKKLIAYISSQGNTNPKTQRPVSIMAPTWAMWSWAMENSDQAYNIFLDAMYNEGIYHSPEEWDEYLQRHAWQYLKRDPKRFAKWLNRVQKPNLIGK